MSNHFLVKVISPDRLRTASNVGEDKYLGEVP
jgi:hypothetical protein